MAQQSYKLSTSLFGHTSDVRAVATFTDGTIVSTSRDKTARVWKPSGNGRDYVYAATLKGHTNFVSSVCVLNPSEKNPTGFIITGGNDKTICIYVPDKDEPFKVLKAHKDTVCKLKAGVKEGTFLSSSWDLSAKLWDINDLSEPQLNLTGHTASVWCVADLSNGNIVTGSADKLIIVWSSDGFVRHKLSGHTDCVRDISVVNENEFLSCSNDATVRHWNASLGVEVAMYEAHSNYIYSIISRENSVKIFTCAEDRTIRVWQKDQTITLPCQSVWSIDLLSNEDLVCGTSDGVVRIFTCDPERFADSETLQEFEQEVASTQLNAQTELGGIKIKDLPDAKALEQPGQKDGQTKLIKDGAAVKAYSWSQNEQRWIMIGDVMGATGGTAATSGKKLHNGIEYDYVFSVDIQDGVPPLKLPYNHGQDPWHVAQKFLHDNDLSQSYLDQVANFIIKNSQSSPGLNASGQFADPFTGGNRYIPSSTASATEPSKTGMPNSSYIPHTKYLKIEQANLQTILDKLRELNSKQTEALRASDDMLDTLVKLAKDQSSEQLRTDGLNTLKILLNWPDDVLFPVLDITRLAVLSKEINDILCTDEILQITKKHMKPDASASNQMLTFRLLANMFAHEKGEELCLSSKDEILKLMSDLKSLGSKNNQVAVSTYILNLTVALSKHNDKFGKAQCLNTMFHILSRLNEPEAVFRTLVGLGTLLCTTSNSTDRDNLIKAVRQSEVTLNILKTMSETDVPTDKLANCSKQIINLIV
ncbi:phospholipase A2 activator protein [Lasioglossum baleicum]|uniref:phospholipase A2 activator protein n=1 Tax=Lasioglossum baleicum TaxID=434251 RepID=UPI003FCD8807